MSTPKPLLIGFLTVILTAGFPAPSLSQDTKKPEAETRKADPDSGDGVQQYCSNIANFAADARIAWQMKRLGELEAQTKQRIAELEAKEVESKDWIDKRAELMKKAEDGVVAIYAKMQDATAAALLTKLNARVSSAILNEMEAGKAARLTELMSGAIAERKKS
jgi:flagellar motility protein MotE (MotC chaperone)